MSGDLSRYVRRFAAGDEIFREGAPGDSMFFIHAGAVTIEKDVAGKAETLATLHKGDFFGEMSLLDHLPRSATATAAETTELLEVTADNFEQLLAGNVEIAIRMIRKYIARVRETNQQLQDALRVKNALDHEIQEFVRTSAAPAPRERAVPLAILRAPGGEAFHVYFDESVIGRADPATGISPDVDLTEVDAQKTTSRRHATLAHRDGAFWLREEIGVRNGTFVNGQRLASGKEQSVPFGAELRFGQVQLRLSKA